MEINASDVVLQWICESCGELFKQDLTEAIDAGRVICYDCDEVCTLAATVYVRGTEDDEQ